MAKEDENIRRYRQFMHKRLATVPVTKPKTIALFELHMDYPTHIAYGEISIVLRKMGIEPYGFKPIQDLKVGARLQFYFQKLFRIDKGQNWSFHIFRSIGINSFLIPKQSIRTFMNSRAKMKELVFTNKDDVLSFRINDVLLGDLFYDWHMNRRKIGTITISSGIFRRDLRKFLKAYYYWDAIFATKTIHSVFVSHTCYAQGILTRVAIKYSVHSLLITGDRMYKMNDKQLYADSEYEYYNPQSQKQFGYEFSAERAQNYILELRKGRLGVDASHAQVSGYTSENTLQVIEKSERQKNLIVAHCFSDSPNGFGLQLYPDYYEWLTAILEISVKVDADWYIRPHPGFINSDFQVYNSFLLKYPHVIDVGIKVSIPELIKQGITTVLTSHGTVGFEAALEGAIVIGASKRAFYKNYSFVTIPKSREDLIKVVSALNKPGGKHNFSMEEIYHYCDFHHLRSESSWLFREKYERFLQSVGGLRKQFTNPATFGSWLSMSANDVDLQQNEELIANFIQQDSYFYKFNSKM